MFCLIFACNLEGLQCITCECPEVRLRVPSVFVLGLIFACNLEGLQCITCECPEVRLRVPFVFALGLSFACNLEGLHCINACYTCSAEDVVVADAC